MCTQSNGNYLAKVDNPEDGWRAFFIQVKESDPLQLHINDFNILYRQLFLGLLVVFLSLQLKSTSFQIHFHILTVKELDV